MQELKDELMKVAETLDYGQQINLIEMAHAVHDERLNWRRLYPPDRGVSVILPVDPFIVFRDRYGNERTWVGFVKVCFAITFVVSLLGAFLSAAIGVPLYLSASRSAEIYNSLNATHYSTWDFFWAGDQINSSTHTVRLK